MFAEMVANLIFSTTNPELLSNYISPSTVVKSAFPIFFLTLRVLYLLGQSDFLRIDHGPEGSPQRGDKGETVPGITTS